MAFAAPLCFDHLSPAYVDRWCPECEPPGALLPGWAELVH